VVIYVGNDSKYFKEKTKFGWQKKKSFQMKVNQFIIIMFLFQIGISLVIFFFLY